MITLIAAIGRRNEIGYNNRLLCRIPEDMKHFKEYTMGKVTVMGSNTYASIGGRPLPGRKSIVVSSAATPGAIHAKDIESALSVNHCYPELVVIGGASVYNQTIDLADKLVITHVDAEFEADTFFPQIDMKKWMINSVVEGKDENFSYKFIEYLRNEATRTVTGKAGTI
jgi:dihydrofolate reductase